MLEYRIVWMENVETLTKTVNAYIEDGWIPQGGLCAVQTDGIGKWSFFQAMTREKEPEYVEFENKDKFNRSMGTVSRIKLTGDEHLWMDKGE